jgi:dephospho-CoA kinase
MPKAIIICGSPGAGKSTYAQTLSGLLLDIDTVTERLVKTGLRLSGHDPNDRDSNYYKDNFREPVYETLFDIALENLRTQDVLIVGPFTKEIRNPGWISQLTQRLACTNVEVHYVYCDPETRIERVRSRGNSRDISKLENWQETQSYYGNEERPSFEHLFVDTTAFVVPRVFNREA